MILEQFSAKSRQISLYCGDDALEKKLPVVILNAGAEQAPAVYEKCREIGVGSFVLAVVSGLNWNAELSPWAAPGVFRGEDFSGGGEEYLRLLEGEIAPQIAAFLLQKMQCRAAYYAIAGYSLAGLFAVYCGYQSELFSRIASVSGSLWFPGFWEFARENRLQPQVEKLYFSLGSKEKRSRNPVLATVEETTRQIERLCAFGGASTLYEQNEGNHFQDPAGRMAKGIRWILA